MGAVTVLITTIAVGGNWAVTVDNLPGLTGATYLTGRLGINNLRDVP